MSNFENRFTRASFYWKHEFLIPLICFISMLFTHRLEIMLLVIQPDTAFKSEYVFFLSFYVGVLYLSIVMTFRSFSRWSRYRLSQFHPVLNFVLNILIVTLPFAAVIASPILLYPLFCIHLLSHLRSPDKEERGDHLSFSQKSIALVLGQMAVLTLGFALWFMEYGSIHQIYFWDWFIDVK